MRKLDYLSIVHMLAMCNENNKSNTKESTEAKLLPNNVKLFIPQCLHHFKSLNNMFVRIKMTPRLNVEPYQNQINIHTTEQFQYDADKMPLENYENVSNIAYVR